MADPYYRHASSADGGTSSISKPSFPGYFTSEDMPSLFHPASTSTDMRAAINLQPASSVDVRGASYNYPMTASSTFQTKDTNASWSRSCNFNDLPSSGIKTELGHAYQNFGQTGDATAAVSPGVLPGVNNDRASSVGNVDESAVLNQESNILFVDKLPTDCTRREVGHLFRPFVGYKDIKVVHKEPRHKGDKALILCFVEFVDSKCARTAMDALQGYKFDDKKPDSPALRIEFAHFPFSLPSNRLHENDQYLPH